MIRTWCLVCGLFFLGSAPIAGQVVLEMSSGQPGAADRMYIKNEMVRVDSEAGGEETSSIFGDDRLVVLNHGSRSYMVIDKERMTELSGQMQEARAQLDAQLANMPPEQRRMMEKMMQGRMPGMTAAPEPLRVERGSGDQVGEYACTNHDVYRGDDRQFEICTADPDDIGPAAVEARDAFESVSEFTAQLTEVFNQGPMAGMINNPYAVMSEVAGIPVRTRFFNDGQVSRETMLISINRQEIDDSLFSPPEGYSEQDLPVPSR